MKPLYNKCRETIETYYKLLNLVKMLSKDQLNKTIQYKNKHSSIFNPVTLKGKTGRYEL